MQLKDIEIVKQNIKRVDGFLEKSTAARRLADKHIRLAGKYNKLSRTFNKHADKIIKDIKSTYKEL